MDFFEAQARAKKRTSRLVILFLLAVLGTIVAMYLAAVLALSQTGGRAVMYDDYGNAFAAPATFSWWQPGLFVGVTFATLAVVALGSLFKWSQFSGGGSAVAESVGGRRVDPNTRDFKERQLLNVVEEMAIAAGLSVPAVYLLDHEPGINAFAAGLTTNDAIVAVTRGTLDKLTRDELQGVIGHEFSHILNGDMRLNLRIAALIFGILVLGVVGRGILWSMRGTRSRDSRNSGGTVAVILVIGLSLVIIGYFGYFFGRLIQAAVSRQREFLADASSVQFTRNPAGIVGALKKIGGDAMGSTMEANQSAAIGHFFFAQAFRTGITGLWATHPPLDQRIRAIDPSFDGKFIVPAKVADVAQASVAPAEHTRTPAAAPATILPPVLPAIPVAGQLPPSSPVAAVAAAGVLTSEQVANAQAILDATPMALRQATQTPQEALVLLCGLLLDGDPAIRAQQRTMVAQHAGDAAVGMLDRLDAPLRAIRDEQRLPLVQLSLPALRQVPRRQLEPYLAAFDDLIRADNQVSPFEFALQRMLLNALPLRPARRDIVQYPSFQGVADEIGTVLSVLAGASTSDATQAPQAFAAGAKELPLIADRLAYSAERARDLAAFDAALDKLAAASPPIKQRTLVAAAHVVQADGRVLVAEYELLRAVAAALDVPMPPLAPAA